MYKIIKKNPQGQDYRNEFTSTGYVINLSKNKMLLIYHKKLKKWLPAGGHLEQNELPHECVIREVYEETGIKADFLKEQNEIKLSSATEAQVPSPYCILYELIPATHKDIEHKHIDFIYILQANESHLASPYTEINDAKWLTKDEIMKYDTFIAVKIIAKKILK